MFEKIKEILADQLNYDKSKITENTSLTEDMLADSLDVVSVVEAFESEFNVSFNDDDINKISTVKDIENLIKSKIK